jgi:high-affinity nickel permease
MSRGILKRLGDRITESWQMFPLGFLFAFGFDTATEVGLWATSAFVWKTQRIEQRWTVQR